MQAQTIEPLTDDELKAIADDPALVAKLTSEERRRLTGLMPPTVRGNDRTRQDTNIVGVNHDWIANHAANLPEPMRYPAAFAGSLAAHLLESLTSPEAVAIGAANPVDAATSALGRGASKAGELRSGVRDIADTVIKKKLGIDPDAVDMASTRMRLQAGRSRGRQVDIRRDINALQRPETPATPARPPAAAGKSATFAEGSEGATQLEQLQDAIHGGPAPTIPNGGPSTTPPAAAAPPSTPEGPPSRAAGRARQQNPGSSSRRSRAASPSAQIAPLTDEEHAQAAKWAAQGMPLDKIAENILASRQLTQSLGTPTPDAMRRAIATRNATGRWPEE